MTDASRADARAEFASEQNVQFQPNANDETHAQAAAPANTGSDGGDTKRSEQKKLDDAFAMFDFMDDDKPSVMESAISGDDFAGAQQQAADEVIVDANDDAEEREKQRVDISIWH